MFSFLSAGPTGKNDTRIIIIAMLLVCVLSVWPTGLSAQVVNNPTNGHSYEYVRMRGEISWHDALAYAAHRGGYLATITDTIEADIVAQLLNQPDLDAWLGASEDTTDGRWHWITGESWSYTNWAPGEPSASDPGDNYLRATYDLGGAWDNARDGTTGYIVEYEDLHDSLINLIQWSESDGGNGHHYALIPPQYDWIRAEQLARMLRYNGVNGHLATVTSAEENQFITNEVLYNEWPNQVIPFKPHYWLGGIAYGNFEWVTGEPFDYTNWADGHPHDMDTVESIAIIGPGWDINPPLPGQWIARSLYCTEQYYQCPMAVVEFDTNEPSIHRILRVPSQFPTIMAAIREARDGDKVLVDRGTYHEAINFLGKDILVQSIYGPQETIITNDRTTNLVTFDHGESRRAVLEGFTLQGGWMAVLCEGSCPTIKRNICVEQNVWNWAAIGLIGEAITIGDPSGDPRYTGTIGPAGAALINNTIVHSANGGISSFSSEPPLFWNNIVAFNANYGIHQQSLEGQPQPEIGYNDVYGHGWFEIGAHGDYINIPHPGPGAISADPQFNRLFGLLPGSPCIDAGDPSPRYNDPDGTRNDMGAVFHIQEPGEGVVIPTNEWIVVYCDSLTWDFPIGPLARLQAFDPGGVLCGESYYASDGSYGLMPVYRDDPYTDVDEGAEPGDLISFKIDGREVQSNPEVFWTANGDLHQVCNFSTNECVAIGLHAGWNLISWDVAYEGDTYETFASIMDCVDVVQSFEDGALVFDPNLDQFNTLTHVDHHHGYWVRMRCPATLTVCGPQIMPSEWIGLEQGWNLISYWGPDGKQVEGAMATVLSHLQEMMGFDDGARIWLPGFSGMNSLTHLRQTFGYWAKSDAAVPLDYPPFGGMDSSSFEDGDTRGLISHAAASGSAVEPSRNWVSVYGDRILLDGKQLAEGSRVEFVCDEGTLCGGAIYSNGRIKLTPVYGYDPSGEQAKSYPADGDKVTVMVDGVRVYPDLEWRADGSRVRVSYLTTDNRGLPTTIELKQNYPNPFNPGTRIAFEVPADAQVTINVYNTLGQKVRKLADDRYFVGRYEVYWDGRNESGDRVATGVYFYRLTVGEEARTRKMLLLK